MDEIKFTSSEIKNIITTQKVPFSVKHGDGEIEVEYTLEEVLKKIISNKKERALLDNAFLELDKENPLQSEKINFLVAGTFEDEIGFPEIDFKSPEYIYFTNPLITILGCALIIYGDLEKAIYVLEQPNGLLTNKTYMLLNTENETWKFMKKHKENKKAFDQWYNKNFE